MNNQNYLIDNIGCILKTKKTIKTKEISRDYVVGIDYDSIEENRGHLTLRMKVTMAELVNEIKTIIQKGSNYPQFPPEANPRVTYACYLTASREVDCYNEIILQIK